MINTPFRPVEDAMRFETIWLDARLATLAPRRPGLGIVERGAVATKGGRIAFAGPMAELPSGWDALNRVTLDGRWVTPGLVDCHTHLVYAGDRAGEFELRLAGASYEEIAQAGGGIVSTVKATRAASEDDLVAATLPRLDCFLAEGVTTIEIKSGYGLDCETEVRTLRAARRLARERKVEVITSFLGAHALPPEANGDKEQYVDEVCAMIPAVAGDKLADAVDAFCENIAFSPEQTARVFSAAQTAGLPVSCTPTNSRTCTARNSRPPLARCPPTISNTPMRKGLQRWRAQVRWLCCFRARSMSCGKIKRRQSMPSAGSECRRQLRPTAIPARRRLRHCF
jgi:imidazolonepropionase-like amidohydrolase